MRLHTRKIFDRSFSSVGLFAIALMATALIVILFPIMHRGIKAYLFKATFEHRKVMMEQFEQGDPEQLEQEAKQIAQARAPVFNMLVEFEATIKNELENILPDVHTIIETVDDRRLTRSLARRLRRLEDDATMGELISTLTKIRDKLQQQLNAENYRELIDRIDAKLTDIEAFSTSVAELKKPLRHLLGPLPGDKTPEMLRNQYGQTRWGKAKEALDHVLHRYEWDYSDSSEGGKRVQTSRIDEFRGTTLEPLFPYLENNLDDIMNPRFTFYWRFLTNTSRDAHFFGGIWPEVLGTLYLTIGAMIFAIPMGVIAAIYLCEYAKPTRTVSLLRSCISTLAGVPSIVFGLFGLAFFLNTIQVSESKSVLAGALTLSLMILPTVIRASEEAILAVPIAFKEAALGLGAGRWHTVLTVILPAALPGILTGIVISMGRAAGETAPIIFTAAV
ncbi:MAG: phosphate ABC transporter permease PstA, partial [Verrucomicrobiota bacterium]